MNMQALSLSLSMILLSACGAADQAVTDSAALTTSSKTTSSAEESDEDSYSQSVQLASDMPECNKSREGQLIMVEEESQLYVCRKKEWLAVETKNAKGDKGDQGIKGEKGDKGDAGAKGDNGLKGEKGDKGDTGAKGESGLKGDKGDAGIKGDTGETGAKGDKGDSGLKGDKGDTGETGATGLKGDKGDQGIQGIQGIAGQNGQNGQNGQDGEDADSLFQEIDSTTATLSSITDATSGRKISVLFDGVTTIQHSANLILKGNGNFTTSAGDVFEFVNIGSGKWKELSRSVAQDSYARASRTTSFAMTAGWTSMIYDSEISDSQAEYNPATGIFTAKQKGAYTVTANLMTASYAWSAGGSCAAGIFVNGSLAALQKTVMPASTQNCAATTSKTLELNAGDQVQIKVHLSNDMDLEYSAEYNSFTVTKVR